MKKVFQKGQCVITCSKVFVVWNLIKQHCAVGFYLEPSKIH